MLELYKNIKKYRLEKNITQQALAEKAGYKDKSMIAKIEKGLIDLPQSKIAIFAEIFQITQSELMGWIGPNSPHSPRLIYSFDNMITNNRPYVLLILSGFCKTRRIEKNLTEKYVAEKSLLNLDEYIEFEECTNIGLSKIKRILKTLDIRLDVAEYLLDSYCTSYDILTEMNTSPLMLENLAKQTAKFSYSEMEHEYITLYLKTNENAFYANAAHTRTDKPITDADIADDEDIMDSEDF